MTLARVRNTKRNVDLVSSHEDDEEGEWSGLMCTTDEQDPPSASMLAPSTNLRGVEGWSSNDNLPPHRLPLHLKPGEHLIEYEEHFPDEQF